MQGRSLTALLCVMYAGAFLGGFNENLVNMALVSVMGEFAIDSVTAQWLVTGYMIVATVGVTCMAFFYRRVKLRTLFLAATLANLAGSVLGLAADSFGMLLAARLIQAVGTGIFIPMMMNTVLAVTPKHKLGIYMAVGSCIISCSPAFSPVICGAIVTAFGWRYIFLVPIAVSVALIAAGAAFVKNLENSPAHLDVPSVALSAFTLTCLSFGMAELAIAPVVAGFSLVAAAVGAAAFIVRQLHCPHPLIDLTPARRSEFWPTLLLVTVTMMSTFSMSVVLPMYLEGALGLTAAAAGMVILVPVLVNVGVTLVGGRMLDKRGEWPLLPIGFGLIAVGFAVTAAVAPIMSVPAAFAGAVLVFGGVGLVFSPSQTAGLRQLPPEENPFGVALSTTCVHVAACIGPSLFTSVMQARQAAVAAAGASQQAACAAGFSSAMLIAACIGAAGFCVAFAYSRKARARAGAAAEASAGTVAAIMEREPFTLRADDRVREAMAAFAERGVSGMPVVDSAGCGIGFLSDGDVVRYLAEQHPLVSDAASLLAMVRAGSFDDRLRDLIDLPVSAVATQKLVSIAPEATLEEAFALLSKRHLKKVPVVEDGIVVGTLNRSNIIRFAMDELIGRA